MDQFQWPLPAGGTVAGLSCIPSNSTSTSAPKFKPLIVALHGGTYDCNYFDAHPQYTASIASRAFNVPFVSIDRPCYGGTSSFLPVAADSDFCTESAKWLHERILPLLWDKYGKTQDCECIVLLCHSLGVQCGIPVAAMHALDNAHLYPLGGIIASGLGHRKFEDTPRPQPNHGPDYILNDDLRGKDSVMFAPGTVDPAILELAERLNSPIPVSEVEANIDVYTPHWRQKWGREVAVPVMFALAEHDKFYQPTVEHLDECRQAFVKSPRVDASLVKGAPHCMELSYWSQGWYAQCFGFAMLCAAARAGI